MSALKTTIVSVFVLVISFSTALAGWTTPPKLAHIPADYKNPTEKITKTDDNGNSYAEIIHGETVTNKKLQLPGEFKLKSEFVIDEEDFVKKKFKASNNTIEIDELTPGEFRIFGIEKG